MTANEIFKILNILEAAYKNFYSGSNKENVIALWSVMFRDDDPRQVEEAVYACISANKFPPTIAEVREKMTLLERGNEMSEMEAWSMVKQAAEHSCYHAAEEFKKLPPILQRIVGSPSQLRDYALMDIEQFNTIVASNVQRSYRELVRREREYSVLPSGLQAKLDALEQPKCEAQLEYLLPENQAVPATVPTLSEKAKEMLEELCKNLQN